jgi:hypothetical protein
MSKRIKEVLRRMYTIRGFDVSPSVSEDGELANEHVHATPECEVSVPKSLHKEPRVVYECVHYNIKVNVSMARMVYKDKGITVWAGQCPDCRCVYWGTKA